MDLSKLIHEILTHPDAPLHTAINCLGGRRLDAEELVGTPLAIMKLLRAINAGTLDSTRILTLKRLLESILRLCEVDLAIATERAGTREVFELCWMALPRLR